MLYLCREKMFLTGLILIVCAGLLFVAVRRNTRSGYAFFAFMALMAAPSLLMMKDAIRQWCGTYPVNHWNILLLGVLLGASYLPWLITDSYFIRRRKAKGETELSPAMIRVAGIAYGALALLSVAAIIYLLPYTIEGIMTPTAARREYIRSNEVLPPGILTTAAVGMASLSLYCIPAFFQCFRTEALKHFRLPLFVGSLAYPACCFVFAGREGFFIFFIFYLVFGLLLLRKKPGRKAIWGAAATVVAGTALLLTFTVSRFHEGSRYGSFAAGTIGYVAQQPYVFNATVEDRHEFQGVDRCFPLIATIECRDLKRPEVKQRYDWMFGTMWAEFYSIDGWSSLAICAIIFIGYFSLTAWLLARRGSSLGLTLLFVPYLYIESMGWFYFRPNQSVAVNLFWLAAALLPLIFLFRKPETPSHKITVK